MAQQPKRILIIDDEPDLSKIMDAQLQKMGFEVKAAYDGERGFEMALQEIPDCILLDVRMPREDGFSFLRKLRAYRDEDIAKQHRVRNIPVIVLTAAGDNMKALFEAEGVKNYVTKPFDVQKIKELILSLIQTR